METIRNKINTDPQVRWYKIRSNDSAQGTLESEGEEGLNEDLRGGAALHARRARDRLRAQNGV